LFYVHGFAKNSNDGGIKFLLLGETLLLWIDKQSAGQQARYL
jgi:hypothetical protein